MTISFLLLLGLHICQRHILCLPTEVKTATPEVAVYRLCIDRTRLK